MNIKKLTDTRFAGLFTEGFDQLLLRPFVDLVSAASVHRLYIRFPTQSFVCKR